MTTAETGHFHQLPEQYRFALVDANVLSLGGRMQSHEEAWQMVEVFLTTEFTGEERHRRRIDELTTWEQTGRL